MNKSQFPILAIAFVIVVHTSYGYAISLDFVPPPQGVVIGNPVDVNIRISDLGDFTSPSLGTFDLDLSFDPNILIFRNLVFGDPALGDQLDLFALGSLTATTPEVGSLNIFELSFDLPGDLNTLQPSTFALVTVTFDTLAVGTSPLDLTVNALGDAAGEPLEAVFIGESVSVNPIPLPSTLVLLASSLAGLCFVVHLRGNQTRPAGIMPISA